LPRISVKAISNTCDLEHLRSRTPAISNTCGEIFGAVYPWAGELRGVDIARSPQRFIEAYSAGV